MGLWSRKRVTGIAILMVFGVAAAVVAAYGVGLWRLAHHRGAPDRAVAFLEPPDRPAPTLGRVPLFRVARVGDRFEVVDDAGRAVVLRGVHAVALKPPFRPVALGEEGPFSQWRSLGFNAVRLAVPWEALEPTPRGLDVDHVRYVQWFVDAAHRNGMVVIVDNPMEGVSRCLGGAGAPVWAHRPGLISEEVTASDCSDPGGSWWPVWPRRLRWWADFYDGAWTPDDLALQDHLIRVFVKLAEVLQNHPALLGYGLAGGPACERDTPAAWLYPGETLCEAALADFYRRFARAIRAVDADALVFFEQPVRWDDPGASGIEVEPPPMEGLLWSVPARRVEAHAARDGSPPSSALDALTRIASERRRAAWVLAHVEASGSPDALVPRLGSLEHMQISAFFDLPEGRAGSEGVGMAGCLPAALIRPVPLRIGGVPVSFGLDPSGAFTLVFRQTTVYADSWVFVPRRAFYGEDPATEAPEFTVVVSDGRWQWAGWDDQVLLWAVDPDTDEHRLVVKPWGGRRAPGRGVGSCAPVPP